MLVYSFWQTATNSVRLTRLNDMNLVLEANPCITRQVHNNIRTPVTRNPGQAAPELKPRFVEQERLSINLFFFFFFLEEVWLFCRLRNFADLPDG